MIPAQAHRSVILLAPAAQTNSETRTANLDCLGADYATIVLNMGAELNTDAVGPTISLLEADDTEVTSFATFDTNFERTGEDLTAGKLVKYHINLHGRKRYLRLSLTTPTATNDNITVGAVATLSRLEQAPSNTSDMVGDTNSIVVLG